MRRARIAPGAVVAVTVLAVTSACSASKPATTAAPTPSSRATIASPTPQPRPAATKVAARLLTMRLPAPLSRPVVLADGTSFLVCGGLENGDHSTSQVLLVSPRSGTVRVAGTLAVAVHDAAGAVLRGRDVVFGGGGAQEVSVVQTCPAAGSGHSIGNLPQPSSDLVAADVGRAAYVVGGYDGVHASRDVLTTTDGTHFRVLGQLLVGVRYAAVVPGPGVLWVFGGDVSRRATAMVQRVDLRTGVVRAGPSLPSALSHAGVVSVGGQVYLAGGRTRDGSATAALWRVDPVTGRVTAAGRLPRAVSDAGAVSLGDVAYLVGGEGSTRVDSVVALRAA